MACISILRAHARGEKSAPAAALAAALLLLTEEASPKKIIARPAADCPSGKRDPFVVGGRG
jgi:hypothetical protein